MAVPHHGHLTAARGVRVGPLQVDVRDKIAVRERSEQERLLLG